MQLPDAVSRFWTRSDDDEIRNRRPFYFDGRGTVVRAVGDPDGLFATFYDVTRDETFTVTEQTARDMVQHSDLVPLEAK